MSVPVAERVAERLQIEPELCDRVLRALARLIKSQSERDGRVRVPGLGIFAHTEAGLTFEPDRRLDAAVNARYAGLEAVPVEAPPEAPPEHPPPPAGASGEPDAEPHPDAETHPEPADEPAAEPYPEAEPPSHVAEPPSEPVPVDADPRAAADADDAEDLPEPGFAPDPDAVPEYGAQTFTPPDDRVEPDPPPEDAPAAPIPPADEETLAWAPPGTRWTSPESSELSEEAPSEDPPVEAEPMASDAPPVPPPAAKRVRAERAHGPHPASAPPRRSALPWALLTLFVILTAVAAYFWMSNGEEAPDPTARTETPAAVDPSPALTPPPPDTTAATAPAPEAPADDAEAPAEPDDELPRIVPADGGFTWVVASRRDRALAEQAAARFRERLGGQLVPVGVVGGTSGGQSRYRVGIGQVPDAAAANALRQRLGDVLPSDAWLLRLQPDM